MDLGLTLNLEKCQFSMDRLVFMGIILSDKGIEPTKECVAAVVKARMPEKLKELKSFYSRQVYPSTSDLINRTHSGNSRGA